MGISSYWLSEHVIMPEWLLVSGVVTLLLLWKVVGHEGTRQGRTERGVYEKDRHDKEIADKSTLLDTLYGEEGTPDFWEEESLLSGRREEEEEGEEGLEEKVVEVDIEEFKRELRQI